MARTRNTQLADLIKETGWSQPQAASHFLLVASEVGADDLRAVSRSHIAMWVGGTRPGDTAVRILCEMLSRKLGRAIAPGQIGLDLSDRTVPAAPSWSLDTVSALTVLGDDMSFTRRQVLATSAYSAAGAAVPPQRWWNETLATARSRPSVSRLTVTEAHVETVRDAMRYYSRLDQRLGGRAGRSALLTYLQSDVAAYVAGRFPTEQIRRDLMSAAAELVYLAGWTAFDSSAHSTAQATFEIALRMAAEADDAPLAGHILRAAAHQAVDLGHPKRALELAEGSLADGRYDLASHRERALLGVVHARALAANRQAKAAHAALHRAEKDLQKADTGDEPGRVFFFTQAALAHETAATLWTLGDLNGAEAEFVRSVRTRALPLAARTHVVTQGYLGQVRLRRGHIDEACATWSEALDTIDGNGIQSGRTRDAVVQMHRSLSPVLARGGRVAAELNQRARAVLRRVG